VNHAEALLRLRVVFFPTLACSAGRLRLVNRAHIRLRSGLAASIIAGEWSTRSLEQFLVIRDAVAPKCVRRGWRRERETHSGAHFGWLRFPARYSLWC
jgi:hypothetical protein